MSRRPKIKAIVRDEFDARGAGSNCPSCPLAASCKPVRPRGATSEAPRLTVVDSYPSGPADRLGRFTQTASSRFLDKNLDSAGADGAYFTYALLCRPPKGASADDIDKAVEACRPRLERELDENRERSGLGSGSVTGERAPRGLHVSGSQSADVRHDVGNAGGFGPRVDLEPGLQQPLQPLRDSGRLDENSVAQPALGGHSVGSQRGELLDLAQGLLDRESPAGFGGPDAEVKALDHKTTAGVLDARRGLRPGASGASGAKRAEQVALRPDTLARSTEGQGQDTPNDDAILPQELVSWILALDEIAFQATTGKTGLEAWRGSPIDAYQESGSGADSQIPQGGDKSEPGAQHRDAVARRHDPRADRAGPRRRRVIPTWGPGAVLAKDGRRYGRVFYRHVERAWMLATGQLSDFSWGEIVVNAPKTALQKIEAIAHAGGEYAADIETGGLGLKVPLNCIGFAVAGLAVSVSVPYESEEVETLARSILRSGVMITQNGALFDRPFLKHKGYELTPKHEDCLLASSILTPQLPKGLAFQASSEFHSEAHKSHYRSDQESGTSLEAWADSRELREYNAKDCVVTYLLWQTQKKKLEEYV